MDISFLFDYVNPLILGICLLVGFCLKTAFDWFPNKYIPLTALCMGIHRMGVVLMKHFDFKDLMAFGMFILALLTFVFTFCR